MQCFPSSGCKGQGVAVKQGLKLCLPGLQCDEKFCTGDQNFTVSRQRATYYLTTIQINLIAGLEIATDTVANATNISPLATKNSGLVATMATTFLCVDDQ